MVVVVVVGGSGVVLVVVVVVVGSGVVVVEQSLLQAVHGDIEKSNTPLFSVTEILPTLLEAQLL